MKHLLAALIVAGACLAGTAQAHDPIAELEASVAASHDAMQSQVQGQSATLDVVFEALDALTARLDALASRLDGQSAAIDDLYALVDEIRGVAPEPAE